MSDFDLQFLTAAKTGFAFDGIDVHFPTSVAADTFVNPVLSPFPDFEKYAVGQPPQVRWKYKTADEILFDELFADYFVNSHHFDLWLDGPMLARLKTVLEKKAAAVQDVKIYLLAARQALTEKMTAQIYARNLQKTDLPFFLAAWSHLYELADLATNPDIHFPEPFDMLEFATTAMELLTSDEVSVEEGTVQQAGAVATYDPHHHTLEVPYGFFDLADDTLQFCVVVHEMQHARQDYANDFGSSSVQKENEAYLFEAYALLTRLDSAEALDEIHSWQYQNPDSRASSLGGSLQTFLEAISGEAEAHPILQDNHDYHLRLAQHWRDLPQIPAAEMIAAENETAILVKAWQVYAGICALETHEPLVGRVDADAQHYVELFHAADSGTPSEQLAAHAAARDYAITAVFSAGD